MREIRTLRSMSGKRKRSVGFDTKPKPPRLFSTLPSRRRSACVLPQPSRSVAGQVRARNHITERFCNWI